MCLHGKRRQYCKTCGGSGICEHGRRKIQCTECPHVTIPKKICQFCGSRQLSYRRVKLGICAGCEPDVPERTEIVFGNMIIEAFGHEPYSKDKSMVTGAACNGIQRRRPNLVWINPGKVAVVVEIDEDSHNDSDTSCELRKISEQNEAIQRIEGCECTLVHTLRVNPDAYDGGSVSMEDRAEKVAEILSDIFQWRT